MKHTNYINIGVSISLFFSLVIGWTIYTYFFNVDSNFKEGFDPNALPTYDSNSPSNTHNVDLVNDKYSCSNFCGPNAQCAITREQCSSDVDCKGCQPPITAPPKYLTKLENSEVKPLDDAGKLTLSQTPQYSSLTTDIGTFATSISGKPCSLDDGPPAMYQGFDKWTKSFNYGLKLSNEKLTYADTETADSADSLILPQYPVTKTVTGLFYDAGPTASNGRL